MFRNRMTCWNKIVSARTIGNKYGIFCKRRSIVINNFVKSCGAKHETLLK